MTLRERKKSDNPLSYAGLILFDYSSSFSVYTNEAPAVWFNPQLAPKTLSIIECCYESLDEERSGGISSSTEQTKAGNVQKQTHAASEMQTKVSISFEG
jgi:hypothetical protein